MGFKITPPPTFNVTVGISVPGLSSPAPLQLVFRNIGKEQPKRLAADGGEAEVLVALIDSWDAEDDAGNPVPVSLESVGQLIDKMPAASSEIATAYYKGLNEEREKN